MTLESNKCEWWIRWYHARLRSLDIEILIPIFQKKAEQSLDPDSPYFTELRDKLVDQLFFAHKHQPGQYHWHCPCSKVELKERKSC